jgi:hypothetical protein
MKCRVSPCSSKSLQVIVQKVLLFFLLKHRNFLLTIFSFHVAKCLFLVLDYIFVQKLIIRFIAYSHQDATLQNWKYYVATNTTLSVTGRFWNEGEVHYAYCVFFVRRMNTCSHVGFEVLTAVSTKMAVFWVVAPCSLVEVYKRFRGPCCLHHQGDRGKGLWNVDKLLPDYTALQPRRQPSSHVRMFHIQNHLTEFDKILCWRSSLEVVGRTKFHICQI